MDKRWIAILISMIIGIGCGYFISQHSTTIGHAIADVSKSTVSLPYGFSVGPTDETSLGLENRNTKEKIYIDDLGSQNIAKKRFKSELKEISQSGNIKILDNATIDTPSGLKVYLAHYTDSDKAQLKNQSIAYYYTHGHTFYTKLTGFSNIGNMDEKLIFISDSLQPDYKKPQDPPEEKSESELSVDINDVRS